MTTTANAIENLDSLVPSLPSGPLDEFRSKAPFDWRRFKVKFFTEDVIRYQNEIWSAFKSEPVFDRTNEPETLSEKRALAYRRARRLCELNFLPLSDLLGSAWKRVPYVQAVGMYDWSLMVKNSLLCEFCIGTIQGTGTQRHKAILDEFMSERALGCFCLTEMSHGSDTQRLRTTATYCPKRKGFLLHTPDFESAKAWSGNLGKTATHAVVFAQLVTPDGARRGLHSFVVAIRDTNTMRPFLGITIGDMGEKLGLNGVDNGFMMFDQYFVPREALLNRQGDVNEQGRYITPYRDPRKRFGASMGALSIGRTAIMSMASANLSLAVVIGVRYSAARRQFGDGARETPILEYQTQQCRLMPYLASAYVLQVFGQSFADHFVEFTLKRFSAGLSDDSTADEVASWGVEIHAISCAGKPLSSWEAQSALQEVRECCGGHGYLKASRLGELRSDNDANCTYEGDNNVLLQQTSKWLLGVWKGENGAATGRDQYWASTFLTSAPEDVSGVTEADLAGDGRAAAALLRQVVRGLAKETAQRVKQLKQDHPGISEAAVRDRTQVFLARSLSLAYIMHVALHSFNEFAEDERWLPVERAELRRLAALCGANWLEKHHAASMAKNGMAAHIQKLQSAVVSLSRHFASTSAVSLCDVLSPPDHILHSALGHSGGRVYHNLRSAFYHDRPDTFHRAEFWPDLVKHVKHGGGGGGSKL